MRNLRCRCGKILCQAEGEMGELESTEEETVIVIKCRFCKRFLAIHTKGLTKIEYVDSVEQIAHPVRV